MELEPKTFEPTDSQLSAEGRSLDRSHGEAVNLCWGAALVIRSYAEVHPQT